MTHQFLIASYKKDFPWLVHALRSLHRFSHGFLPPVVSVERSDASAATIIAAQHYPGAVVKVVDGMPGYGNMRAQVSMMSGDLIGTADVVHLFGSDCIAFSDFTPDNYMIDGCPVMLMTPYVAFGPHYKHVAMWQRGTANVLGFTPDYEFMRRIPLAYPKEVSHGTRVHIAKLHRMPFEEYVYSGIVPAGNLCNGGFSESNIMGAWAYAFKRDAYTWIDTTDPVMMGMLSPSPVIQFWSHGGLDRPTDAVVEYAPGQSTVGQTPRALITKFLGSC